MRVLIASTTDAATALLEVMPSRSEFNSTVGAAPKPVTIVAWGLADALTVALQVPNKVNAAVGTDADWEALKVAGAAVTFTAATNTIKIDYPCTLRISKADTGEVEVGVGVFE